MPQMRVLGDDLLDDMDDRRGISSVHSAEIDLWVPRLVERRMVEAVRLVVRIAGPVGPKGYGSAMPAYVHTEAELFAAQVQMDEDSRDQDANARNRGRIRASSHDISAMEAALRWPARYLAGREDERRTLALYLRCKAHRKPFNEACDKAGKARSTAYRTRDRALSVIAQGLNADGVGVDA